MTQSIAKIDEPIAACVINEDWSVNFGIGQATKVKSTEDGNFEDTDETITVMNCNGYKIEDGYVVVEQIGDRWLIV